MRTVLVNTLKQTTSQLTARWVRNIIIIIIITIIITCACAQIKVTLARNCSRRIVQNLTSHLIRQTATRTMICHCSVSFTECVEHERVSWSSRHQTPKMLVWLLYTLFSRYGRILACQMIVALWSVSCNDVRDVSYTTQISFFVTGLSLCVQLSLSLWEWLTAPSLSLVVWNDTLWSMFVPVFYLSLTVSLQTYEPTDFGIASRTDPARASLELTRWCLIEIDG